MKLGLPKKRRGKPAGLAPDNLIELSYLEIAPGHFAVDEFSYMSLRRAS